MHAASGAGQAVFSCAGTLVGRIKLFASAVSQGDRSGLGSQLNTRLVVAGSAEWGRIVLPGEGLSMISHES